MDTLTHALSGALVARAGARVGAAAAGPSLRVRSWLGFGAAAFPDVDFLLRLVDPLIYLRLHRAVTHSLVLLPLWALLVGGAAWLALGRRHRLAPLAVVAALGLAIHIAGDLVTAYGTRILAPLSDVAPAPGWVLVIDPWLTALLALALLATRRWPRPSVATAGLAAVAACVLLQAGLNHAAARIGARHAAAIGWPQAQVRALAQPLSPFNRAIIIARDGEYLRARVNLRRGEHSPARPDAPRLWQLHRSYRPVDALQWRRFTLLPGDPARRAVAAAAWRSRALAAYRAFARYPVLYRMDRDPAGTTCAWFTDLRYWYEPLPAPFRYGGCRRDGQSPWRLERLPVRPAELLGQWNPSLREPRRVPLVHHLPARVRHAVGHQGREPLHELVTQPGVLFASCADRLAIHLDELAGLHRAGAEVPLVGRDQPRPAEQPARADRLHLQVRPLDGRHLEGDPAAADDEEPVRRGVMAKQDLVRPETTCRRVVGEQLEGRVVQSLEESVARQELPNLAAVHRGPCPRRAGRWYWPPR